MLKLLLKHLLLTLYNALRIFIRIFPLFIRSFMNNGYLMLNYLGTKKSHILVDQEKNSNFLMLYFYREKTYSWASIRQKNFHLNKAKQNE